MHNRDEIAAAFSAMMSDVAEENGLKCITLDVRPSGHFCAYAHRLDGGCEQGIGGSLAAAVNGAISKLRPPLPFEEAA